MRVFLFAFIVYIQGRTVIGKTRLLETFGAPQAIAKTATIKRSKAFMALPRGRPHPGGNHDQDIGSIGSIGSNKNHCYTAIPLLKSLDFINFIHICQRYAKDMPKICQSPDSDREGPNHLFSNGKSPLPKVNHAQLEWRSFWCCRCKTWFSMGSRTSYTWILDLQVQMFLQNNCWNLICFSNFRIFRPTHQKNVNRACLHSGLRCWFEPHRWEETVDLFTIKNKAKDKNKYHKTQYCNGL